RRLVKDPTTRVRSKARRLIQQAHFREVALPLDADGDWDATGWTKGTVSGLLTRHKQGKRVQEKNGVPVLRTVADLRTLLGIRSEHSTVTNAVKHRGAEVLLKFDLTDFFPTIHYYRVVGLFASFGYAVGNTRFGSGDDFTQVAPTLARLCCYTPDPQQWGNA